MTFHSWPVIVIAGVSLACNTAASPTAPSTPVTPVAVVWETQLYPGAAASRSFIAASSGAVSVTLSDVRPDPRASIGMGVGIPRADGGGCLMSHSVHATSGGDPQLTVDIEPGTYCVRVYDVGALTGEVFFSIALSHP